MGLDHTGLCHLPALAKILGRMLKDALHSHYQAKRCHHLHSRLESLCVNGVTAILVLKMSADRTVSKRGGSRMTKNN